MTLMTMPMQGSDAYDESERTTNVDSYRITCTSFIEDISKDYLAWVDRYDLPKEEDTRRRAEIASIIEKTNHWIFKIAQSIRAIDVVMNDGIQKMAEATAGRPFEIVFEIGRIYGGKTGYHQSAWPRAEKIDIKIIVNFPGRERINEFDMYGRRDISIIMDQSKTRFPIERELVKSTALEKIPRARTQDAYMYEGKEGAKIFHDGGRIDVLPHSLHIWCEFTPQVIEYCNWLMEKVYLLP